MKHGCGVQELLVDVVVEEDAQRQSEPERPPAVVKERGRKPACRRILGAASEHRPGWVEAFRRHVRAPARVHMQRESSSADEVAQMGGGERPQQFAAFSRGEPATGVLHPGGGAGRGRACVRDGGGVADGRHESSFLSAEGFPAGCSGVHRGAGSRQSDGRVRNCVPGRLTAFRADRRCVRRRRHRGLPCWWRSRLVPR